MVNKVFRGERLREVRESRGMSQADFEQLVGVSHVQISRYEAGKTEPSLDIITRFAKALNITVDYLVGMVDKDNEYLNPQDLSPTEARLLDAFRRGDLRDAMDVLARDNSAS